MALEHELLDELRTSASARMASVARYREEIVALYESRLTEMDEELAAVTARYEALCRLEPVS